MKNIVDKIETIFISIIMIIAIGCIIFLVTSMITYEPKIISYSGNNYIFNNDFKENYITFDYNNSSHLIIPTASTYTSYTWNGTAWEIDNFINDNDIIYNLTMQDLINKSDWSLKEGY